MQKLHDALIFDALYGTSGPGKIVLSPSSCLDDTVRWAGSRRRCEAIPVSDMMTIDMCITLEVAAPRLVRIVDQYHLR